MTNSQAYEIIILGAGPAGLTSGLYAARAGLNTIILDPKSPGGQMLLTDNIYNYPGYIDGIGGQKLADLFLKQAEKYNCCIKTRTGPIELSIKDGRHAVITRDATYYSQIVIIATGCSPKKLGIPGEKKYSNAGISYCAVCDGNFFEDMEVAVLGGGDSAMEEAAYLSRLCKKVYVIHRRDRFRASQACQCLIRDRQNISILWDTVVEAFQGDDFLSNLLLRSSDGTKKWDLPVSGAFIYVGQIPNTAFLPDVIGRDSAGWITTNEILETSVAGIYAAGDVRKKIAKQVSTAVGDGALAAISAEKYLMLKNCSDMTLSRNA